MLRALGLGAVDEGGPLFGVGIARFPTAFHRDCQSCMREGAINVLVAREAPRAHILPEYGLSWVGADGLATLEPTHDLLHGNEPSAGGTKSDRACYGCFERW